MSRRKLRLRLGQPESSGGRSEDDRRFLGKESPGGVQLRMLVGMVLGGGPAFLLLRDRLELTFLLYAVLMCGLVCACLLGWFFPPAQICLFVGVDGVMVWGRFVPYAAIKGVREEWTYRAGGSEGMTGWAEADIWTMFLDLHEGEPLRIESMEYERSGPRTLDPEHQNERGEAVLRAIEAGRAAWLTGYGGLEPSEEELVARGERTVEAWVEGLRRLGSGAAAAYRGSPTDPEALARVLAEPRARPSTRAAAAVALAAAGDETAVKKLRIAAAEMADPRLRLALENVAEDAKEAAVVEALAVLQALEDVPRARRTR